VAVAIPAVVVAVAVPLTLFVVGCSTAVDGVVVAMMMMMMLF
jgi:hypothetical protein